MTDNAHTERHVLDATERRMVELLQHDGRLPVAWLAKQLGVTEVTARRKLRGLLARGIIRIYKQSWDWAIRVEGEPNSGP